MLFSFIPAARHLNYLFCMLSRSQFCPSPFPLSSSSFLTEQGLTSSSRFWPVEGGATKEPLFKTYPCQTVHFDIKNCAGVGRVVREEGEPREDEKDENKLLLSPKPMSVGVTS